MNLNFSAIWIKLQAMLQSIIVIIPNLLIGVVVFFLFWLGARLLSRGVRAVAERSGQPVGIALVFSRIASWVMLGVGVLVAAIIIFPTLTAASLFGALGVSGVAIGFAFKDIFQNLLAGILILITRPFKIGDQIVTGSHEGVVEEIQVRATLIRTYDNRRVVVPNSDLYTNRVVVNTAFDRRRLAVTVGIGYGDDIAAAKSLILKTVDGLEGILKDPAPQVLVTSLADFSVMLEVRFWINPPARREQVEANDQVLSVLKNVLIAAGIDLPMPTQQVLFHDQTEQTDGTRTKQREGWPAKPSQNEPGQKDQDPNPLSRQELLRQQREPTDQDIQAGEARPVGAKAP